MIDLWSIPLQGSPSTLAAARAVLGIDERAASRRFESRELAEAFILRRAARRAILAQYLELAPETIAYRETPQGRPEVQGVTFSASHSGAMACLAVTQGGPVGVDIERIHPIDTALFERRVLSPAERADLADVEGTRRSEAVLAHWTAKEAILKASGTGLCLDALPRMTVARGMGEWREARGPGGVWQVRTTRARGYVTSLAAPEPVLVNDRRAQPLIDALGAC